jgi:hypothetical protein
MTYSENLGLTLVEEDDTFSISHSNGNFELLDSCFEGVNAYHRENVSLSKSSVTLGSGSTVPVATRIYDETDGRTLKITVKNKGGKSIVLYGGAMISISGKVTNSNVKELGTDSEYSFSVTLKSEKLSMSTTQCTVGWQVAVKPSGETSISDFIAADELEITVEEGSPLVTDATLTSTLTTAMGGMSLAKMSKTQFDALAAKDANTLYFVTNGNRVEVYLGETKLSSGSTAAGAVTTYADGTAVQTVTGTAEEIAETSSTVTVGSAT